MTVPNTIALIANGAIDNFETIKRKVCTHERVIAVDGGLTYCDRMGIIPNLLIGDFDSLTKDLQARYSSIQTLRFPRDKDETDLEIALREVFNPQIKQITLFGAMGNRIDHSLYNLHLLTRYPQNVRIETENQVIFPISGSTTIACQEGQTISFIPLEGPVKGITTRGLKWELRDANFDKTFMSISNICLSSSVEVSVASGELLCVMTSEG